jgi:hypothetical protein
MSYGRPARGFRRGVIYAIAALAVAISSTIAQDDDPTRQQEILFNGQVQVPAGKRYQLTFTTRSNFRNARIAGNVRALGGSGNDIRVFVVKGQSLVYDSGRRRSVVMSVDFSEPGQYALVFDNTFSLVSPKIVDGTISLVHWGIDAQKNEADKEEAVAHYTRATEVIRRLYAAAKADERVWGTTQLSGPPAIRLVNDNSINARADWTQNTIYLNRGLDRLVDKAGDKGDDVLAATLAHEMGHIFYRHPAYGSGPGVKGLFDELKGVTALDRSQEKEADIFGIRMACHGGFDPQGMLILMRVFAQLDGGAGSFMRNHPTGIERYNYLQGEASRCQVFQNQQRPTPQEVAPPAQANTSGASEPSGGSMWKLVQDPNARWQFKIGEQFLYGEHIYPEDRRKLGDFDTVDIKKQGNAYSGTQRERVTLKVRDASPQGFHYKVCQWTFAVELTSVTEERIEGRWEGYAPGTSVNPSTCERTGARIWEDVAWVRE